MTDFLRTFFEETTRDVFSVLAFLKKFLGRIGENFRGNSAWRLFWLLNFLATLGEWICARYAEENFDM